MNHPWIDPRIGLNHGHPAYDARLVIEGVLQCCCRLQPCLLGGVFGDGKELPERLCADRTL